MIGRRCVVPLVLALCVIGLSPLHAQVMRLPAIDAVEAGDATRFASYPGSAANLGQAPGELTMPKLSERPPEARQGMFQKLIFSGTWLGRNGDNGFGTYDLETKTILALPIPSRTYPLIITPGFGVHYLDGPANRNLPPRTYDAYAQFRWMRRLGSQWGIDLAVTQGVFSDFEHSDSNAHRTTGHGIAAWTYSPTLKYILGLAYIDRFSTDFLPVCGLVWTPHADARFDLVFPHPKIATRVYWSGCYDDKVQDWLYIAGELGGGIWAIAEPGSGSELIDYTDYRVFLGLQRKAIGGLDARMEVGYVFGRKIRFERSSPEFRPRDTVMLRGTLTY